MLTLDFILMALVLIFGFYAAWNIGANDVANAMGTSVGSGALTMRNAVILAAIFEFAGAVIVGANVSETVRKKMFDPAMITEMYGDQAHYVLACGMIAALMAAGTWLLIATWASWPVSTTHSIVGAVVGFGIMALGIEGIEWGKVGIITAGWVVSPLISGSIAYLLFSWLLKAVFYQRDPVAAARRVTPWLAASVVLVLSGVTSYKGLKPLWKRLDYDPYSPHFIVPLILISLLIATGSYFLARRMIRRLPERSPDESLPANPELDAEVSRSLAKAIMHMYRVRNSAVDPELKQRAESIVEELEQLQSETLQRVVAHTDSDELKQVEQIFVLLQVMTACMVAFAHGSNDVANAIGPLSAAWQALKAGVIQATAVTPTWALLLGGVGIVVGLATWGWRVIQTVGKRITELTPSRGFCAEFAAAITILVASILPIGLPVSTTHTLVGAVMGVGMARGIAALNMRTARDIVAGWAITIPAGAGLCILFYAILKAIFIGG